MNDRGSVSWLIVDRRLPDSLFLLRRNLGPREGAAFAKWLAAPERGHFLLLCTEETEPGERYLSAADEQELLEVFILAYRRMCFDYRQAGVRDVDFHLGVKVLPETRTVLERAMGEIRGSPVEPAAGSTMRLAGRQ